MEEYPSLAEGIGLENRQAVKGAGVRIPLPPPLQSLIIEYHISRDRAVW